MKAVKLFYQERCPFCKKALRYIEELKEEYPEFQPIEIEMIEETQHPDIADNTTITMSRLSMWMV